MGQGSGRVWRPRRHDPRLASRNGAPTSLGGYRSICCHITTCVFCLHTINRASSVSKAGSPVHKSHYSGDHSQQAQHRLATFLERPTPNQTTRATRRRRRRSLSTRPRRSGRSLRNVSSWVHSISQQQRRSRDGTAAGAKSKSKSKSKSKLRRGGAAGTLTPVGRSCLHREDYIQAPPLNRQVERRRGAGRGMYVPGPRVAGVSCAPAKCCRG